MDLPLSSTANQPYKEVGTSTLIRREAAYKSFWPGYDGTRRKAEYTVAITSIHFNRLLANAGDPYTLVRKEIYSSLPPSADSGLRLSISTKGEKGVRPF